MSLDPRPFSSSVAGDAWAEGPGQRPAVPAALRQAGVLGQAASAGRGDSSIVAENEIIAPRFQAVCALYF